MEMIKVFLVFSVYVFWQEMPFKPSNEFEATVDLQFKSRPVSDRPAYDANGNKMEQSTGLLPFLTVNLLHVSSSKGEVRFRALDANGKNMAAKKLAPNASYRFDLGFIEDLKSGEVPTHDVTVIFMNEKKEEISKVTLAITKEGDFLVNGEKRGQF